MLAGVCPSKFCPLSKGSQAISFLSSFESLQGRRGDSLLECRDISESKLRFEKRSYRKCIRWQKSWKYDSCVVVPLLQRPGPGPDHFCEILGLWGRWAHLDVVRFWDILVTSDWVVTSDRVYVDYYKKCRLVQDLGRYRVYTETTIIVTTK